MGTIGRVKRRMVLAPVKGLEGRAARIKGGNRAEKCLAQIPVPGTV
jgi:hypothetical protein